MDDLLHMYRIYVCRKADQAMLIDDDFKSLKLGDLRVVDTLGVGRYARVQLVRREYETDSVITQVN